jgi:hypothetical protein
VIRREFIRNATGYSGASIALSFAGSSEVHSSPLRHQTIADINAAFRPELIGRNGVEAFVTGGPDQGKLVNARRRAPRATR